ncbi:MAG: 50S ribosomal protein L29 [Candidatus Absconditabacterales bacterium]
MKGKGLFMKELSEKTIKDLVQTRRGFKKDLYDLKMKNAIKGLKETHKLGDLKIKIARTNTVLTRKIQEKDGDHRK